MNIGSATTTAPLHHNNAAHLSSVATENNNVQSTWSPTPTERPLSAATQLQPMTADPNSTTNERLQEYFKQPPAGETPPPLFSQLRYGSTPPSAEGVTTENMSKELVAATLPTSERAKEIAAAGFGNALVQAWQEEVTAASNSNGGLGNSEHGFLAWGKDGFIRYRNPGLTPEENRKTAEMSLTMGIPVEDFVNNNHEEPSFTSESVKASVGQFFEKYDKELQDFLKDPEDGLSFREGRHNYKLDIHKESGLPQSRYLQKARGFKGWVQRSMDVIGPVLSVAGMVLAPVTGGLSAVAASALTYGANAYAYGKKAVKGWATALGNALSGYTGGVSAVVAQVAEDGFSWKSIGQAAVALASRYVTGSSLSDSGKVAAQAAATIANDYIDDGKIEASTVARGLATSIPQFTDNKALDATIRRGLIVGARALDRGEVSATEIGLALQPYITSQLPEDYQNLSSEQVVRAVGRLIDEGTIDAQSVWAVARPLIDQYSFEDKQAVLQGGDALAELVAAEQRR